jgi:tRNA(fMet)-specific endonuclease VapC
MRRLLLDTGIAGPFINHLNPVYDRVRAAMRKGDRVGICVPVLGELYDGAENSASRDRSLHRLKIALGALRVWPYTNEAAAEFGRLRTHLRRAGRTMQIVDIQIAAIALTLGNCTVVTTDDDLAAVPGLRTENWTLPPA